MTGDGLGRAIAVGSRGIMDGLPHCIAHAEVHPHDDSRRRRIR